MKISASARVREETLGKFSRQYAGLTIPHRCLMRNERETHWAMPVTPLVVAMMLLVLSEHAFSADPQNNSGSARVAWTTSHITGSPEPPLPYITEPAFPSLKFNQCLDLVAMPGSERLFVVEQSGKVFSFRNDPNVSRADLVIDFAKAIPGAKEIYSLAFHPDFKQNRRCFVCYIEAPDKADGTHVSQFQVSDSDPPTIDAATEVPVITWRSGGHNGCCLKFGPDGYLYISTGDAGPANPPDVFKTGQDLSDLLSSILRIDVDHVDQGRNYRIPADNPFVDHEGARAEIWSYGLRNPWRMSFDRKTGDLWVGDVGWELWEMLYRIERGGNYGWAVMEGHQSTHPEWPRGPTAILPPVIDHSHSESSSITEGLTYYGSRLKRLHGMHIYSDYDTGKFWGFRYVNGQVVDHHELADTTHRVVGFGEDLDGEFYILDHTAGTLHRMIPNPQPDTSRDFPRKLNDTGLFSSVKDQKVAPGVISYSINAEPWADFATADRFVAVPGESSIKPDGATWTFPKGSVLVRTLSLEKTQGDPASRRMIETQILHFDGVEWMPYTYEWNDEQTDASLVKAAGAERTIEIVDGKSPGGRRHQTWRFSGRAECQRCHNRWSGPPLAFNSPQLNKEQLSKNQKNGPTEVSQLDLLSDIGLLDKRIPEQNRSRLVNPYDQSADLDGRARAYLQVNCAHCHRMHAGGAVLSQMHYDLTLDKTNMLNVRPTQGTFGIHAAHVLAPGDPYRSVLLYRMSKLGGGRMPHIGSTEVDQAGTKLIHDWVHQLPRDSTNDIAGHDSTMKLRANEATALERLQQSASPAVQAELVDQLLASTSGALMLLISIDDKQLPNSIASTAIERANRHSESSIRDLFERFLPAERRVKRLGSSIAPRQILSLNGDASRGRKLFFETSGVSCKNCHRVQKDGKEVGPELTSIGKKLTRGQLLESILEPSKQIDPKFVTYLVETVDGQLLTGLLVSKTIDEVVLKDAQDKQIRIPNSNIEQLVPQRQSLMPELLLRDLTAQQVADLVEYLSSLK
jgi:putative heme-binding domain-containing protein